MHTEPLVSVLLPVYNAASYVQEAIESILRQTYRNFELIVVDDGSTDESGRVIQTITDPRIRVVHQPNRGLSAALNRAIEMAQGVYLARQDADDLSLPQRLDRQVDFLEAHPAVGMVGTWAEVRTDTPKSDNVYAPPTDNHLLKFELLFDNPFIHSSVMIRKHVLVCVGVYTQEASVRAEDYDLWSRIVREFDVSNLSEMLNVYRDAPNSKLKRERDAILENVINISMMNLSWVTKRDRNDPVINDLSALSHGAYHRVQGYATSDDLRALLFQAADRVSGGEAAPAELLRETIQARWCTILHHYDVYNRYYKGGRLRRKIAQFSEMVKRTIPLL
ncbi:MAG: glycosyltransferase family 2 protein [Nitrospira sp.]|nr:glycosyltransferase family 2 protein [Nitrospira sp.]